MKNLFKKSLLIGAMGLLGAISMSAESAVVTDASDMEWNENINTPAVPSKANASLARHMETLMKWFKSKKLDAHMTRKNEVVVITLPASTLFAPNSTELLPAATQTLSLLEKAVTNPESYRILVAAYTDDTGDEEYSDKITEARAEAVHDVLDELAAKAGITPNIYHYFFGLEKPLVPNTSIENRAKNRRVEIYLIPETRTIDAARSGKLS